MELQNCCCCAWLSPDDSDPELSPEEVSRLVASKKLPRPHGDSLCLTSCMFVQYTYFEVHIHGKSPQREVL